MHQLLACRRRSIDNSATRDARTLSLAIKAPPANMRITVSDESPQRILNTSTARRWVKYNGYKWEGKPGKSSICRDPDWKQPSSIIVQHISDPQFNYPGMTLIALVAGNRFPVEIGKHRYETLGNYGSETAEFYREATA